MTKPTDLQTENESLRARVAELEEERPLTESDAGKIAELYKKMDTLKEWAVSEADFDSAVVCRDISDLLKRAHEDWRIAKMYRESRKFEIQDLESQLTQIRREIEAMREDAEVGRLVREISEHTNVEVYRIAQRGDGKRQIRFEGKRIFSIVADSVLEALRKAANDE